MISIKTYKIWEKEMQLAKILRRIYYSSLLRWWFIITSGSIVSSTCPCCGKSGCPIGIGSAAVFGGFVVLCKTWIQRLYSKLFKKESETRETKNICLTNRDK
jgi:hypothetical protein